MAVHLEYASAPSSDSPEIGYRCGLSKDAQEKMGAPRCHRWTRAVGSRAPFRWDVARIWDRRPPAGWRRNGEAPFDPTRGLPGDLRAGRRAPARSNSRRGELPFKALNGSSREGMGVLLAGGD